MEFIYSRSTKELSELVQRCPCVPGRIGIWKCWFLWREENRRTRGKRTNNKLNPHMTPSRVRESSPGHIGGRRELSPLRHPCFPCEYKCKCVLTCEDECLQEVKCEDTYLGVQSSYSKLKSKQGQENACLQKPVKKINTEFTTKTEPGHLSLMLKYERMLISILTSLPSMGGVGRKRLGVFGSLDDTYV